MELYFITSTFSLNVILFSQIQRSFNITIFLQLEKDQPHLCEDTNLIWRTLCIETHGKRSAESIEGSGESWKEGFIRLRHESEAKLKLLTQKITKKKLQRIKNMRIGRNATPEVR